MHHALRKLPPNMTVAEFLDWPGDGSGRAFQLVDGELRAMSPGSATHGTIQANLCRLIGNALVSSGPSCRIVTEPGVNTRIRSHINMRVPDLGITRTVDAAGQQTLPDPIALIEVLSPGNAADTWDNVWAYTTIPSVREIAVVHSTRAGRGPAPRLGWALAGRARGDRRRRHVPLPLVPPKSCIT
jgi:Uma2 family endonuclease